MIDYVDTVTTIELGETVVTVETRIVELITIEVPGLQGAKGDALTLTVATGGSVFNEVDSIEIGDNLQLTENPDGSLKITAEASGLGGFEIEMTTGLYEYYANHNLDRYMHAGAITSTDGVVMAVGVENVDELGDPSRNTCRIYSAEMMYGTLNVI